MIEPAMMATSIAKEKAISAHDKKREREKKNEEDKTYTKNKTIFINYYH